MWAQLLKSILNLFCGAPATTSPGQTQPHSDNQQYQYPPHGQQHPHKPHTPPSAPGKWQQGYPTTPTHGKIYQDANQINQHNEYYVSLRAQANEHGDQMAKCFQEGHEAYARGDGALAKELSNQGKDHQRKMEQLNRQASDFIFVENNKDSKPGEVDLHGLYVKEAIARADEAIQQAKRERRSQINFIVGKGLHSQGGVAKIKPAIEELIQKYQLIAQLDPANAGVLVVLLEQSNQSGINADEISRRLQRDDEGCTIM